MKATIDEVIAAAGNHAIPQGSDFPALQAIGLGRKNFSFPYIKQTTLLGYLWALRRDHPELYALLSGARLAKAREEVGRLNQKSWEFEGLHDGGRGEAYNKSQEEPSGRSTGMLALLRMFSPDFGTFPPATWTILDALGGDGTIARLAKNCGLPVRIVSADLSGHMVDAALRQRLPAIRQAAGHSFLRDNSLDGVFIGYGAHHLDADERDAALAEAYRTLKPGRRAVLHDFEEGGSTAAWFRNVVHPYSRTGHPYPHFRRSELLERFDQAGFGDVRILNLRDPFTVFGASADAARLGILQHLYWMYDLVKLDAPTWVERLTVFVESTLGPITVAESDGRYVASVQRTALVAIGTK